MLYKFPDGAFSLTCGVCMTSHPTGLRGERESVVEETSLLGWEHEPGGLGLTWCPRCSSERRRPRFPLDARGRERRGLRARPRRL